MHFGLTRTTRLVGSLLTLAVGSGAAYVVAGSGPVAALGLGMVLACFVYLALTLAARTGGLRGLTGYRLITFVLVLALALAALGVTFLMQPDMKYAGAVAALLFSCAAFNIVAAVHALARLRKDRAGP